jgi:hypothetical protein
MTIKYLYKVPPFTSDNKISVQSHCTDILLSEVKGGTLYRYFIVTSKRWNFVQIFYCQKSKVELCTDILLSQVKIKYLYKVPPFTSDNKISVQSSTFYF